MKPNYLLFIVCCLSFATSQAQTISLDEVLNKIEQNNLSLLSYENKIKADDELVNNK